MTGVVLLLTLTFTLTLLAPPLPAETQVRFPIADPRRTTAVTSVWGRLYRPDGPGPFPALVLLHGSTGVEPYHFRWAEWLKIEGYVALVVDSFGPRGMSRDPPSWLTGERVWDAFGALAYLRSLPFVAQDRVGAMGWSLGGGVALLASGALFSRHAPPSGTFRAVVAFYPLCGLTDASEIAAPVLFLLGEADTWTPPDRCVQIGRALKEAGMPVEWIVYPGASHGFDFGRGALNVSPINVGGYVLRYDERATADAEHRIREFLTRYLLRPP